MQAIQQMQAINKPETSKALPDLQKPFPPKPTFPERDKEISALLIIGM